MTDNKLSEEISIDCIKAKVAAYYESRILDMDTSRRGAGVALPRQVAMYFARKMTSKSFPEIGAAFGGKHHTTVMYAYTKVVAHFKSDYKNQIQQDVMDLTHILEQT